MDSSWFMSSKLYSRHAKSNRVLKGCQPRYELPISNFLQCTNFCYFFPLLVKVHMTSCPTDSTPGPKWYKLEAISQVTLTAVGTFLESHRRSEAYLCRNKTVSEFNNRASCIIIMLCMLILCPIRLVS